MLAGRSERGMWERKGVVVSVLCVADRGADSLQQGVLPGEAPAFVFRLGESEQPLGLRQSARSELKGRVRAGVLGPHLEKVVENVLFVSFSGHVGSPCFHCSEGLPTPGKDRTLGAYCHHLRRRAGGSASLHPGTPSHLIEEHG